MKIDQAILDYCSKYNMKSTRYHEFLQLLMDGMTTDEMAEKMGIKKTTNWQRQEDILRRTNKVSRYEIMAEIYLIEKERKNE